MLKKLVAMLLVAITVLSVLSSCTSHEHSFDEEEIIEQQTSCVKAGKKVLKCSCGATKTQSIPKAHSWSSSECGDIQYCTMGENCTSVAITGKPAERHNPNSHTLDYATKTCKNCGRHALNIIVPDEKREITIYNASGKIVAVLEVEATIDLEKDITQTDATITWRATKISNGDFSDTASMETVIAYTLYEISSDIDSDGNPIKYVVKSGTDNAPKTVTGDITKWETFKINRLELWGNYVLEFADVYI